MAISAIKPCSTMPVHFTQLTAELLMMMRWRRASNAD